MTITLAKECMHIGQKKGFIIKVSEAEFFKVKEQGELNQIKTPLLFNIKMKFTKKMNKLESLKK